MRRRWGDAKSNRRRGADDGLEVRQLERREGGAIGALERSLGGIVAVDGELAMLGLV